MNSLALRLVLGAACWIVAALLAGGLALSAIVQDDVERGFDARLDVLLQGLVAVAERGRDGALVLARGVGEPRFERPLSGWYWQVSDAGGPILRSRSLWDEALAGGGPPAVAEAAARDVAGPDGERLRLLERDIALPGFAERLRFAVAGPRAEIEATVRAFNRTLAWSLGALGGGLLLALLIQVRFGLQPLRRVRQAIAAVRTGRAQRLEGRFPTEIAPLSDEINALLAHNAQVLERARTQAGNLAHALKTPLSVLTNEAAAAGGPLAETVARQAAVMRGQIDHHLARARTAAAGSVLGARTEVAEVAQDLRRTLARIHADRGLALEVRVPPGLAFRGERQDLEEMLGNLADNACKWARTHVVVAAAAEAGSLVLTVDDDGPGLSESQREAVFGRGKRLDESVPGSGHGLAIVREIAELYGGSATLGASPLGGLRATLALPAAA